MKKSTLVAFSISVFLGLACLSYESLKNRRIKRLVKRWSEQNNPAFTEEQQRELAKELDQLWDWEVRLLDTYARKLLEAAPETELAELKEKLRRKKIFERCNLKAVESLLPKPD